jgi:hypothetical protein
MNKGRVGEDRESKETDGCPLTGAVGADAAGKVAGAAMGDQAGGRGCGMPIQKEKRKDSLFFGIRIGCSGWGRGGHSQVVRGVYRWVALG